MDPVVGAALVQAGGEIVGNLANQLFGEDAAKTAYKRQRKLMRDQIPLMVEGAVEAGLHPLAAIGINPATGPAAAVGGDFSRMGASLGRATEAMLTPTDKIAAQAALLDLQQRQANVDLTRAQLAGAQKALISTGSTPGVASVMDAPGKGNKLGGASVFGRTDAGQAFWVPPGWSAEQWEQEFGELIAETMGLSRSARSAVGAVDLSQGMNPADVVKPGYGIPEGYHGRR